MKNIPNYIVPVTLDSTGEVTKSRWLGTFNVKCVLTHADKLAVVRLYTLLLPTRSDLVEANDKLKAETLAQLSVRVVSGPEWWDTTRGGQLLVDENPLYDLLLLCQTAAEDWSKRLEQIASEGDGNVVLPESIKP